MCSHSLKDIESSSAYVDRQGHRVLWQPEYHDYELYLQIEAIDQGAHRQTAYVNAFIGLSSMNSML